MIAKGVTTAKADSVEVQDGNDGVGALLLLLLFFFFFFASREAINGVTPSFHAWHEEQRFVVLDTLHLWHSQAELVDWDGDGGIIVLRELLSKQAIRCWPRCAARTQRKR